MTFSKTIQIIVSLLLAVTITFALMPTVAFARQTQDTVTSSDESTQENDFDAPEGSASEDGAEDIAEEQSLRESSEIVTDASVQNLEVQTFEPGVQTASNGLINYQTHIQGTGWQSTVADGVLSGTSGKSLRVEALEISLADSLLGSVVYSSHVQNRGWQAEVADGVTSGTTGESLAIEAVRISLSGEVEELYDIYYRVHSAYLGWLGWASNGQPAGSAGYGYRVEAIEILLVPKDDPAPGTTQDAFKETVFTYQAHLAMTGWQGVRTNGQIAGTVGQSRALEALRMNLTSTVTSGDIVCEAYVQRSGWQTAARNGQIAGTTGKSLPIQALRISLSGDIAVAYDVYYRVHIANIGWLGWTSNGNTAGTIGYDRAVEAIEIRLVIKGDPAPGNEQVSFLSAGDLIYQTHLANYGWQKPVSDGATAGTTGQSRQIEALTISLGNAVFDGSVSYEVFVANKGWVDEVSDGSIAGATGQGRSVEGLKASLSGAIADEYDLYYRLYVSHYGWLDWAIEGEAAGMIGCNMRVEAMEMKLVLEGTGAPEGSTGISSITVAYGAQAHAQSYGWMGTSYAGRQILGTTGKSLRLEAMKLWWDSTSSIQGGIRYSSHVSYVGWQDWAQDGELSGTTGQSRSIEAVRIELTGEMASQFNIYYRAHVASVGWLGWAKNGEDAGTTGYTLPVEAVEVAIVPVGLSAPGSTNGAFYKALSGDYWLDGQLRSIVAVRGYDLRSCFNYVAGFSYTTMSLYPTGDWAAPFAKQMLQNRAGNCYRYAALFCMLAKQLGYTANVVSGSVATTSGRAAHGWVEITINGQVYICDPTFAHSMPSRNWYMNTYSNAPVTYYR